MESVFVYLFYSFILFTANIKMIFVWFFNIINLPLFVFFLLKF